MVTMSDVASRAGVSMKTVSRVINDEPHVRPAVKEKVTKAIAELDYQPNVSARRLAGTRAFVLSLIYNNPNDAYVTGITGGALKASQQLGYGLMVESPPLNGSVSPIQMCDALARNRSDGVILTPPFTDDEALVTALAERGIPMVMIGGYVRDKQVANVLIDEEAAGYEITRHLLDRGHSRIAYIAGPQAHRNSALRERGVAHAMHEAGLVLLPAYRETGKFDFGAAMAAAQRLLDLEMPPTAIFAANDEMAAAVLAVARERGLAVPGDLAIAGFDDTPFARAVWPQLTTIRQPFEKMAKEAVELLVAQIRGSASGKAGQIILPHELMVRGSTSGETDAM